MNKEREWSLFPNPILSPLPPIFHVPSSPRISSVVTHRPACSFLQIRPPERTQGHVSKLRTIFFGKIVLFSSDLLYPSSKRLKEKDRLIGEKDDTKTTGYARTRKGGKPIQQLSLPPKSSRGRKLRLFCFISRFRCSFWGLQQAGPGPKQIRPEFTEPAFEFRQSPSH